MFAQSHRLRNRLNKAEWRERIQDSILTMVAHADVQRFPRLIAVAQAEGLSPSAILERVEDAVARVYSVKSYTETEIDLARLVWHLAGEKGAYILHKALGMPCVTTLRTEKSCLSISPCTGKPVLPDLAHNLTRVFPPMPTTKPALRGHVIMCDGLANDKRLRRDPATGHVTGTCRECVEGLDLSLATLDAVIALRQAMQGGDPRCHFGSEATVFAIAAFCKERYHALPILVSASCKRETANEFAELLELSLLSWKLYCKDSHGEIWVVGCDGASVFRGACFISLMCHTFSGELYRKLSPLRGLNLKCGLDNVVHCPDPKHVFKHTCC